MRTTFTRFPSPLGELVLTASDTALTGVHFPTSRHGPPLHEVERTTGAEDDGHGTTTSYGELARRLGDPRATRAVGAANGKNPIPIIVPCHRVVGARGELTGFGGGLDRKRWLLEHEGALMTLGRA